VGPVLRTPVDNQLAGGSSGISVSRNDVTVAHVPRPRRARQSVTVLDALDEPTARLFWELYQGAFGPLRTRAAARQVLTEDEFFDEMTDPRVWKYVVHDATGQPVGLTTLTSHLATVPWISPEYYEARYPQHFARQAVYYLGFTLVVKGARNLSYFATMIEAVSERVAADRGVCGYDICAFNNEAMRFDENIEAMLNRTAHVPVERLDSQTYYVADFSEA
jgi:hypothetical protein